MRRTVALRAIGRGLAMVEPSTPNLLIAYAAKAGSTAQDGDGKDSPFAVSLAQNLTKPGLDVRRAFGFVRDDVMKSTANRQEPFVYGSLGGDDVPLVPAPVAATPVAPAADPQADIRRDYELAVQVGNTSAFNAFLAQHPDGFYANLARTQLEKLAGTQPPAAAPAAPAAPATPAPSAPALAAAPEKLASISPAPSQPDLTKSVQTELRRVGCLSGDADGDWNTSSQRSLSAFNRNAGTKLDIKTVNADTLDAIKQKQARVCPLVCDHGYKADGNACVKIVCAEGSVLNDDNECEKRRDKKPVAKRDSPAPRQTQQAQQPGYAPEPRQSAAGRYQPSGGAGIGSHGQPLTGVERAQGCNGYGSIMSGVCP
jgi:hypothetical protein